MIDTDKYEGHTEGKWILGEYKGRPSISAVEDVETPTWVRSIARGLNSSRTADHALLLDAPLLLEEVKRLENELANANDLLHDVVIGHNLRTKNRKMWDWQLYEDDSLTMLHLHEWFLKQQEEAEE